MITIRTYSENNRPSSEIRMEIINFLFENLEQYGDPKQDIEKALEYALGEHSKLGGVVLTARNPNSNAIDGAVIVNKTGMENYIPENILVYIATAKESRGKGIGKELLQETISVTKGDIALHCEPDNPARFLYEKLGFTSKYLEMRLKK